MQRRWKTHWCDNRLTAGAPDCRILYEFATCSGALPQTDLCLSCNSLFVCLWREGNLPISDPGDQWRKGRGERGGWRKKGFLAQKSLAWGRSCIESAHQKCTIKENPWFEYKKKPFDSSVVFVYRSVTTECQGGRSSDSGVILFTQSRWR